MRVVDAVGWMWLAACGRLDFDLDDAAIVSSDAADAPSPQHAIFAVTGTELFAIDPALQATLVRDTTACNASAFLGDVAVDSTGSVVASDQDTAAIYQISSSGSGCTAVSLDIGMRMFALAFVPAGVVDASSEVLLGGGNDGVLYRIDPSTGGTLAIGSMGFVPSGDFVWTGTQLILSTSNGDAHDGLAAIDPATGSGTLIGTTGFTDIYGLVSVTGMLLGFTNAGETIRIDPDTATTSLIASGGNAWTGAASN